MSGETKDDFDNYPIILCKYMNISDPPVMSVMSGVRGDGLCSIWSVLNGWSLLNRTDFIRNPLTQDDKVSFSTKDEIDDSSLMWGGIEKIIEEITKNLLAMLNIMNKMSEKQGKEVNFVNLDEIFEGNFENQQITQIECLRVIDQLVDWRTLGQIVGRSHFQILALLLGVRINVRDLEDPEDVQITYYGDVMLKDIIRITTNGTHYELHNIIQDNDLSNWKEKSVWDEQWIRGSNGQYQGMAFNNNKPLHTEPYAVKYSIAHPKKKKKPKSKSPEVDEVMAAALAASLRTGSEDKSPEVDEVMAAALAASVKTAEDDDIRRREKTARENKNNDGITDDELRKEINNIELATALQESLNEYEAQKRKKIPSGVTSQPSIRRVSSRKQPKKQTRKKTPLIQQGFLLNKTNSGAKRKKLKKQTRKKTPLIQSGFLLKKTIKLKKKSARLPKKMNKMMASKAVAFRAVKEAIKKRLATQLPKLPNTASKTKKQRVPHRPPPMIKRQKSRPVFLRHRPMSTPAPPRPGSDKYAEGKKRKKRKKRKKQKKKTKKGKWKRKKVN